jgi:hypothetical protein
MSVGSTPTGYTYHPAGYRAPYSPLPGADPGPMHGWGRTLMDVGGSVMAGVAPSHQTQMLQTKALAKGLGQAQRLFGYTADTAAHTSRMAGTALLRNPLLRAGMKWGGPLAAAFAVGDLVTGDESIGNKAMDAGLMVAGGALGSFVPIVGTSLGVAAGKAISDGTQWLFGDKKTPEQRRMEEALAGLQQGIY